jgi:hypothetical protein
MFSILKNSHMQPLDHVFDGPGLVIMLTHILVIPGFPAVTGGISCFNDYETYQMKLEICC